VRLFPELALRLFALIGALLVAGGAYLMVEGSLRLKRAIDSDAFHVEVWRSDFWLYRPSNPKLGLSPNAHWFLRLTGGIASLAIGARVLRVASR
jgi:hypothetical protein